MCVVEGQLSHAGPQSRKISTSPVVAVRVLKGCSGGASRQRGIERGTVTNSFLC
jgi:hypothetical protein